MNLEELKKHTKVIEVTYAEKKYNVLVVKNIADKGIYILDTSIEVGENQIGNKVTFRNYKELNKAFNNYSVKEAFIMIRGIFLTGADKM